MTDVWQSDGSAPFHPSLNTLLGELRVALNKAGAEVAAIDQVHGREVPAYRIWFRSFSGAYRAYLWWAMTDESLEFPVEGPRGLDALRLWVRESEWREYSMVVPAARLEDLTRIVRESRGEYPPAWTFALRRVAR